MCVSETERGRRGERETGADLGRYEIMTKNNRNIVEIKEGKIKRETKQHLFNRIIQKSFLSEFWVYYLLKVYLQ